jgi:hypothetical protein
MHGITLSSYVPTITTIKTHTSKDEQIINEQCDTLFFSDLAIADSLEAEFGSKYQGEYNPFYNCHGLTFACKRTAILPDEEIWKIINSEYKWVKDQKDVIVGDIILYFLGEDESSILHSGIVVDVTQFGDIKIYSKVKKGREIVHSFKITPYFKGLIKFYRIDYGNRVYKNF